jgi:NAD(P)-dependent dehydrogenase (short-subunit alcohol dehydrogenase family)
MEAVSIVTGGTSGIGAAIAEKFVEHGVKTIVTYRRPKKEIYEPPSDLIKAMQVDGSNLEEVKNLKNVLAQQGLQVQYLVNCAGATSDRLLLSSTVEDVASIMQNNFFSVVNYCLTFLDKLIASRNGNIVNISSVAARKAKTGNCSYGCSKIAIERFSQGLALECAQLSVRVNCVAPGFVETEMFRKFAGAKANEIIRMLPAKKILPPQEVAQLVVDLALRRISTTGSTFTIGNGENI